MIKKTGGMAFPCAGSSREDDYGQTINTLPNSGMTLRDYFAGKAMQGIISDSSMWDLVNESHAKSMADDAYLLADAMLKARSAE